MFSSSVEALAAGPLHDISKGGLFIRTETIKPIGTEITLKIAVPIEGVTLQARGIVVHTISAEDVTDTSLPAGMGIMFTELDDTAQGQIERLIQATLRARRTDD